MTDENKDDKLLYARAMYYHFINIGFTRVKARSEVFKRMNTIIDDEF